MISRVTCFLAALSVILTHSTVLSMEGQPTSVGFQTEAASNSLVAEQNCDAIYQLNMQVQSIREFFRESLQQLKTQQDIVKTSLQAVELRTQEEVQSIREILNASFQQIRNQQDSFMKSLQAIDRRSQEQDVYIKQQVQSIHDVLNETHQQMKHHQDTVVTSLQALGRRSQEQAVYITQSQSILEVLNT